MARLGRADDRADVARGRPRRRPGPELVDERGDPLPHRSRLQQLQVLDVSRARVGRAHQHEHAAAASRAAVHERLERVAAHQRVDRHEVGAQPVDAAERAVQRRRSAQRHTRARSRRCRRACRPRSRAGRHRARERRPPPAPPIRRRRAASKRASCSFTATHACAVASISARQCSSTAAAAACAGVSPAVSCSADARPQRPGVGVQAEHDLRLALGDPRGQRVAEGARRVSGPSPRSSGRCPR